MHKEIEINWQEVPGEMVNDTDEVVNEWDKMCPFKLQSKSSKINCVFEECIAWIKPNLENFELGRHNVDPDIFGICGMLPIYQGLFTGISQERK